MQQIILFIIIHSVVCVFLYIVKRREKGMRLENIMPVVIALPVFGAVCFGIRLWEEKHRRRGAKDTGLDKTDVMKGRYKKIRTEDNPDMEVVPLEEALLINNAKVRHALMLDILHQHPNEYVDMLQKARNSDDMEVTHYATTMMMELLTEYETAIQDYDHRRQADPSPELLQEYILYLNQFIALKLIGGNIEKIYRQRLAGLIEDYGDSSRIGGRILFISIENYLLLGEYDKAYSQLERASVEYPEDERLFRMYGYYYDCIGDHEAFEKMLDDIKDKQIYLSLAGREWLEFWGKNGEIC